MDPAYCIISPDTIHISLQKLRLMQNKLALTLSTWDQKIDSFYNNDQFHLPACMPNC